MDTDSPLNYIIPLIIGIGVMAACGIVAFTLILVSLLAF